LGLGKIEQRAQTGPKVLIAANGIHRNSKGRVSVGPLSDFIDPWRPMSSFWGVCKFWWKSSKMAWFTYWEVPSHILH